MHYSKYAVFERKPPVYNFYNQYLWRGPRVVTTSIAAMAMFIEYLLKNNLQSFVQNTKLWRCFQKRTALCWIKIESCFCCQMMEQFMFIFIESLHSSFISEEVDFHCSKQRHPKPNLARKCRKFCDGSQKVVLWH